MNLNLFNEHDLHSFEIKNVRAIGLIEDWGMLNVHVLIFKCAS